MSEQQEPGNSAVIHAIDMLRRDMARMELTVKELVSLERYTIERESLKQEIADMRKKVETLEAAKETMRNMIYSSFLFPLAVAVIFWIIQSSGAS